MICVCNFRHYTLFGRPVATQGTKGGEKASKREILLGRGQIKIVSRGGVGRYTKELQAKNGISNFGNRTARESPECGLYYAKFILYLNVELVTSLLFLRVLKYRHDLPLTSTRLTIDLHTVSMYVDGQPSKSTENLSVYRKLLLCKNG